MIAVMLSDVEFNDEASSPDNREAAVAADRADTVAGGIADSVGNFADTAGYIAGTQNIDAAASEPALAGLHSRHRHGIFQTLLCRFGTMRRDRLRVARRSGDQRRHRG